MRTDIIARQVAAHARRPGLDALIVLLAREFRLCHRLRRPLAAPDPRIAHAMASSRPTARSRFSASTWRRRPSRKRDPDVPTAIWARIHRRSRCWCSPMLTDMGLGLAKRASVSRWITCRPATWRGCTRLCRRARFEPCEHILARLRQIKTPEEIALLRRLSRIADQAITDALAAVAGGDTEMDIAGRADAQRLRAGRRAFQAHDRRHRRAQPVAECRPDRSPAEARRRLPGRDLLGDRRLSGRRLPDGRRAGGAAHGRANLAAPGRCKYRIMEMVKPGAVCRAIYDAFIAKLAETNLPPISFVGHGIGLHLHEDPYLGKTPILGRPGERCAGRGGHGARLRAAVLPDRLRLRHAEQGHAAGHRRAARSFCRTMPTRIGSFSSSSKRRQ